MKQRIITGVVLGLIFIPAVLFGGIFYTIITLLLSVIGTFELMNMFYKKNPRLKHLRFIVPAFSALLYILVFRSELIFSESIKFDIIEGILGTSMVNANVASIYLANIVLCLCAYILFIIILMIVNIFIKGTEAYDIQACVLSLTYGGFLLSLAFSLEFVLPISFAGQKIWGGQLFACVYLIICFTDIFAFFFGCKFGKHKLCPTISPKKSVEGAISGLVFGSFFGVLFAYLFDILPITKSSSSTEVISYLVIALFVSMVISILGQIGDLVASKLKRTYEIKDYGNIFPGHGGVMDRFDSFIFAGSFVYICIILFRLIILGVI